MANGVERYGELGGDEEIGGGFEMVDLGALAGAMEGVKSADAVAEAIRRAVVCKAGGKYRRYGNGISVYYNLSGQEETSEAYGKLIDANDAFASLTAKWRQAKQTVRRGLLSIRAACKASPCRWTKTT